MKKPIEERFWKKVSKTDTCWNWTAAFQGNGYGYFRISLEDGATVAHRFSYFIHFGKIPNDMHVCHSCDNRACVNPSHLFLGTPKDNAIDRENKNRSKTHGPQKLNEESAYSIYISPLTKSQLARMYGVSRATILKIKTKSIWKKIHHT